MVVERVLDEITSQEDHGLQEKAGTNGCLTRVTSDESNSDSGTSGSSEITPPARANSLPKAHQLIPACPGLV